MEREVEFYSGGQRMVGDFQLPAAGAPCVLMSHGFESSKDGDKWRAFAPQFYRRGFATLKFSYRGCGTGKGKSDGAFENTTLTGRIEDYKSALNYLESTEVGIGKVGAIGSSFGGMIALAADDNRVKAIVTLATPYRFSPIAPEVWQQLQGRGYLEISPEKVLREEFFHDMERYDILQKVSQLHQPLLIIHGSRDEVVPVENAYRIYERAKEPKRLEIIEGGDHSLNKPQYWERIMELSLGWFGRYL
jgi:dipeptidyl aminopeptidase/acylaminoacyl peptidase